MERIDSVINHLQEQGYSTSWGNSYSEFFHMFKPTNPPEFYPRFHLEIPVSPLSGFDLARVGLHFDIKEHKTRLLSGEQREATVSEIKEIIESLKSSPIDRELKHPLLAGLNDLLYFQTAEFIRRPESNREAPFNRLMRLYKGRTVKHIKYKRDYTWKLQIEE